MMDDERARWLSDAARFQCGFRTPTIRAMPGWHVDLSFPGNDCNSERAA